MNNVLKNSLLLSSLLMATFSKPDSDNKPTSQPRFHDPFSAMMSRMEKQIQFMKESLHDLEDEDMRDPLLLSKSSIDIAEDSQNKNVTITVKNLHLNEIDASIQEDENKLTIKAPTATIQIGAREALLVIYVSQKEEQKSDKNGNIAHFSSIQSRSESRLLKEPVSFAPETIKLDYNEETQTLTITLQTLASSLKSKKLPVTVHSKKQQDLKS